MEEVQVTFQPSGRTVFVLPGSLLIEAAARAGRIIRTPCGGAGKCGKCLVRITGGDCPVSEEEGDLLTPEQVGKGYRLACRCRITGPLTVEIPETSLFQSAQKILSSDIGGEKAVRPVVCRKILKSRDSGRRDTLSDVEYVRTALGPVEINLPELRKLPGLLRSGNDEITATLLGNRLVDLRSGGMHGVCPGLAFDIGTTTVVGTLVDICTGKDIAVACSINPQTGFGDDVLSRIKKCREDPQGLEELSRAIIETVNSLTDELAAKAGIDKRDIFEAVFAGNAVMQEVFCGIDPSPLGELPFVAAFRGSLTLPASELGLDISSRGSAIVLPQIGGFVGGDTVAGILAAGMDEIDEPALFVDIGTNGELALANKGRITATSVAAGPAFEGARITHGMRASSGAVEKVVMEGEVTALNVVGNVKPSGICGTGLIDLAALLLDYGVIDSSGRIPGPGDLRESLPEDLRRRVIETGSGFAFVFASSEESANGEPLCLYQKDIRELQLANGAIRAGISILLKKEKLEPEDIRIVFLAGAFGNFVRRKNALRIGMLPRIPTDKIRFVGNTASFGAKQLLLSSDERVRAEKISAETVHLDLSLDPDFQEEFGSAMIFP